MTRRDVVVAEVRRLFGDALGELAERLSDVDEADGPDLSGLDPARRDEVLRNGTIGLSKLAEDRPDELTEAEVTGLEAIIALEGRPALFIQGGDFFGVPPLWHALNSHRDPIRSSIARVGRVDLAGHDGTDWVGTGFLAGPDAIITNRHVAEVMAASGPDGWRFRPGLSASLDFNHEQGAVEPQSFALTGIVGVHDQCDLAVLAIAPTGGADQGLPGPLAVATAAPGIVTDRPVYVIGYPGWDGTRNDAAEMRRIFSGVYEVKRLQPGLITSRPDGARSFTHDCSTLGGNSGSPVIDLETHQVVGLHFSGGYLAANNAIPLWLLADDELLRAAGVNFV
jgi:V8-like Glu-specific endopeptidase